MRLEGDPYSLQKDKEKALKKYGIESNKNRKNLTDRLHTQCTAFHSTMYPVWFLSWRKDDRVAYATVNGQTGKVVADLPIDIKQFLKGALVLAIPLFVLLNFLGTMKPHTLLSLCCLPGLVTTGIYLLELRAIRRKESNEEDLAPYSYDSRCCALLSGLSGGGADHAGGSVQYLGYSAQL